eukprot:scaffold14449_cov273-Ochromonas_danica.AAC.1
MRRRVWRKRIASDYEKDEKGLLGKDEYGNSCNGQSFFIRQGGEQKVEYLMKNNPFPSVNLKGVNLRGKLIEPCEYANLLHFSIAGNSLWYFPLTSQQYF